MSFPVAREKTVCGHGEDARGVLLIHFIRDIVFTKQRVLHLLPLSPEVAK